MSVSLLPGIASFFNHSCTPNVEVVWNSETRRIEFNTVQDVQQFSQLRFGYLDLGGGVEVVNHGVRFPWKYGFKCRCKFDNEVSMNHRQAT